MDVSTGSPWLSRLPSVRLDAALRPRGVSLHSPYRARTCCLLAPVRHRPLPTRDISGLNTFTVGFHPLPLHLAFSRAYASSILLPARLQGSIPGPRLPVTWAGFPPAGLRDLARPQHRMSPMFPPVFPKENNMNHNWGHLYPSRESRKEFKPLKT